MDSTPWMISSRGRSGSKLLTRLAFRHIKKHALNNQVTWVGVNVNEPVVDLGPWSVCHTHSIEQIFKYNRSSKNILSLRRASDVALSILLAVSNNYTHVFPDKRVKWCETQINNPKNNVDIIRYCKHIIDQNQSFLKQSLNKISIEELNFKRTSCIEWNNIVSQMLSGRAIVIDYDVWKDDPTIALNMMGISDHITPETIKDPVPLIDRVENRDEISRWLAANEDEDRDNILRWTKTASI